MIARYSNFVLFAALLMTIMLAATALGELRFRGWPNMIEMVAGQVREVGGEITNVGDEPAEVILELQIIGEPDEEPDHPPEIALAPERMEIPPGEVGIVTITINAREAHRGFFDFEIRILTDDPRNPEVVIAINVDIMGIPRIVVEPDRIEYEGMGDPVEEHILNITNTGSDILRYRIAHEIIDEPEGNEREWLTYDPDRHFIEPDEDLEEIVTLNPEGLINGLYEAELIIDCNDPRNPEVFLPVTMEVGGVPVIHVLLEENWNLISINVSPGEEFYAENEDQGPNVILMTEQLRIDDDNHHLRLMKNEDGRFYSPAFEFNNIPYWNLTEGYMISVDEDVEAAWEGDRISFDADIPLEEGWNFIAYFPTYELDANRPDYYVLSPIIERVIIAKNGQGHFMLPGEFDFSNMPPWQETQGYQVRVDADVVLNYPPEQDEIVFARNAVTKQSQRLLHFVRNYRTGKNMSVLITSISGIEISTGSEVVAFNSDGQIVGLGTVNDRGQCGIAVWGDDLSTEQIDGLEKGESYSLKLWDVQSGREHSLNTTAVLAGDGLVYETDEFTVLEMALEVLIPTEFFLSEAYPNPFNSTVRLTYGLREATKVSIRIFDIRGRLVANLATGKLHAGFHSVVWDGKTNSSGIYFVRMSTGEFRSVRKVMLVK